ncbi:MAG: hypothetical protein CVU97_02455 [Firmicutes bacterium HGW-Firmicutes-21]|nr:MAG: hypothetical protein CVU97_02455 [Firmicutes bacterium HGW-Firmicutes-21]
MNIEERIASIITSAPSDIGILITDKNGNITLSHNEKKRFRSASVIKTFVLSFYIDEYRFPDEIIKFDSSSYVDFSVVKELCITEMTIKELLTVMIASSDNTATNALINKAGPDLINAYIQNKLRLTDTAVRRYMMDFSAIVKGYDNYTSAFDTVTLLKRLAENPVAMKILAMQKERNGLMRYIYGGVDFFGKSGQLDDVYNDSGIIQSEKNTVFAAVLTNNIPHTTAATLCGLCGLLATGNTSITLPG